MTVIKCVISPKDSKTKEVNPLGHVDYYYYYDDDYDNGTNSHVPGKSHGLV